MRAAWVAISTVIVLSPFVWMALDNTPPYAYNNVTIEPTTVKPGDDIHITFHVREMRSCGAGLIYREFIEAEKPSARKRHVYDPILRSREPIVVDGKFTRIATIPDGISPGLTLYRGAACYFCNPLQRWLHWPVCIPTPEVPFTVVRNPDQQRGDTGAVGERGEKGEKGDQGEQGKQGDPIKCVRCN
jgi:hypothetical protein